MVNWLYKWYNPRGRWGAEEISSAFLAMVEDGSCAVSAATSKTWRWCSTTHAFERSRQYWGMTRERSGLRH
jgi:hypothetical protein